jgi:hypothetical protein
LHACLLLVCFNQEPSFVLFLVASNLRFYSCKLELITDVLRFLELLTHCRDLNPLHNVIDQRDYKEKYFKRLIPLGLKYCKVTSMPLVEHYTQWYLLFVSLSSLKLMVWWLNTDFMQLFPWGGKLTSESLKFFSPIVIWTKFPPSQDSYDALYSAFTEYYKVA